MTIPKEAVEKVLKEALVPAWELLLVLKKQEDDLPPPLEQLVRRFYELGTGGDALEDTHHAATQMVWCAATYIGLDHPTLGQKIKDACDANVASGKGLERLVFHEELNQGWPPEGGGAS